MLVETIERTLGALSAQVHGAPSPRPSSGQLDFYLSRWLPSATLRVDYSDRAERRLLQQITDGTQDHAEELTLGQHDYVGNQPSRARIGTRVAIRIGLQTGGASLVGRHSCYGTVALQLPSTLTTDVRTWSDDELADVELRGELVATGFGDLAELLGAVGLDPVAAIWSVGGHEFPNSLTSHRQNLWSWTARREKGEFVFGHGDLHDGNVLCVGQEFTIIDLGLAGEHQPRWADAARLLGSLLLNVMAVPLGHEGAARALYLAFIGDGALDLSANDPVQGCAAILRKAFNAAIHSNKYPTLGAALDLWIDIHHFCFIAIKWCRKDLPTEQMPRVTAMALLAAVAAIRVEQERVALEHKREQPASSAAYDPPRAMRNAEQEPVGREATPSHHNEGSGSDGSHQPRTLMPIQMHDEAASDLSRRLFQLQDRLSIQDDIAASIRNAVILATQLERWDYYLLFQMHIFGLEKDNNEAGTPLRLLPGTDTKRFLFDPRELFIYDRYQSGDNIQAMPIEQLVEIFSRAQTYNTRESIALRMELGTIIGRIRNRLNSFVSEGIHQLRRRS